MSDPTAAQIAADVTIPTYEVELWNGAAWVTAISYVERLGHVVETTDGLGGFAFGTARGATADITIDAGLFATSWAGRRIRIGYGFSTSNKIVKFVGVITGRQRGASSGSWRCGGLDVLLEGEKVWSPLFRRRPIATLTTISSVEDPTAGNYAGGIMNYLAWTAGGRPYDQAGTYPTALFYYEFEQALIAPEWSWLAGENPWNELGRLCRACGGQVYQDDAGTLRYVSPLSLAEGAPTYTFTDEELTAAERAAQSKGPYADLSEDSDTAQNVTAVSCTYTGRDVMGYQIVYEDTEIRQVRAGATATLTLDTQIPIYDPARMRIEVDAGIVRTATKPTAAQLVATITDRKATRFTVTLQNTMSEPIQVYGLRLWGRPVSATEEGSAFFSASGELQTDRVLEIPDNPLIQSRSHAERLCRMVFDFAVGERGKIGLRGCPMDTRRYVGEPVSFTSAAWAETATLCRIVAIRPTGDGYMDVDLGRADGLPVNSDMFQIGTTYSNPDVRQVSY